MTIYLNPRGHPNVYPLHLLLPALYHPRGHPPYTTISRVMFLPIQPITNLSSVPNRSSPNIPSTSPCPSPSVLPSTDQSQSTNPSVFPSTVPSMSLINMFLSVPLCLPLPKPDTTTSLISPMNPQHTQSMNPSFQQPAPDPTIYIISSSFFKKICCVLLILIFFPLMTGVFLHLRDQSSWMFPWHLLERECGSRNTATEVVLVVTVRYACVSHHNVLSERFCLAVRAICLFSLTSKNCQSVELSHFSLIVCLV